jgi:hypothetical protein
VGTTIQAVRGKLHNATFRNFFSSTFYYIKKIRGDDIVGTCNTHGGDEKVRKGQTNQLGEVYVKVRLLLKRILKD